MLNCIKRVKHCIIRFYNDKKGHELTFLQTNKFDYNENSYILHLSLHDILLADPVNVVLLMKIHDFGFRSPELSDFRITQIYVTSSIDKRLNRCSSVYFTFQIFVYVNSQRGFSEKNLRCYDDRGSPVTSRILRFLRAISHLNNIADINYLVKPCQLDNYWLNEPEFRFRNDYFFMVALSVTMTLRRCISYTFATFRRQKLPKDVRQFFILPIHVPN